MLSGNVRQTPQRNQSETGGSQRNSGNSKAAGSSSPALQAPPSSTNRTPRLIRSRSPPESSTRPPPFSKNGQPATSSTTFNPTIAPGRHESTSPGPYPAYPGLLRQSHDLTGEKRHV